MATIAIHNFASLLSANSISIFFFFQIHLSLSFSLLSLYGGYDGVCLLLLAYFNRSSVVEWNFSESQWEGTLKFMD